MSAPSSAPPTASPMASNKEIGLSATALDDGAALVKGAVRAFFPQVKALALLVLQTVAAVAEGADPFAGLAVQGVARVAAGDAPPLQRLREGDQLAGDAAVEGGGRRHLRQLVGRLLARSDTEGKGQEIGARLAAARNGLPTATPHPLRRAGHALEATLDRGDPAEEAAADRFVAALTGDGDDPNEAPEGSARDPLGVDPRSCTGWCRRWESNPHGVAPAGF